VFVAVGVSVAVVAVPLVAVALGLLVFPLDFLLRIIGAGGATGLVDWYTALAKQAAAPEAMPTWLPRPKMEWRKKAWGLLRPQCGLAKTKNRKSIQ